MQLDWFLIEKLGLKGVFIPIFLLKSFFYEKLWEEKITICRTGVQAIMEGESIILKVKVKV